jgi:hypothetical protein
MASVMQADARPLLHHYATASGDGRHDRVSTEHVWGSPIHRVVTEGVSPEQGVDEAIARIKQTPERVDRHTNRLRGREQRY